MSRVRDYFKKKYDRNGPAYLPGVLRTINKMPPEHEEAPWEEDVQEK